MMLRGATMALAGRDGIVCLDEAWVFLGAGKTEVDRLDRLAGSQRVSPMLATQKVSDAVNAGLAGAISRGFILHLPEREAYAACELFDVEPTPELIGRITAGEWEGSAPNPNSLKALWSSRDADRENVRGSVAYVMDIDRRFAPVEIPLPKKFVDEVSTSSHAVDARTLAAQAKRAAGDREYAAPQ
jgi:hypothetical protein